MRAESPRQRRQNELMPQVRRRRRAETDLGAALQRMSAAVDHALVGADLRATCSGRLDRSAVSRTAILWRNFSVSDRAAAKLSAMLPTAAKYGSPVISSSPDAATIALAKVAARPNLGSVLSRIDVPFP
jgi:hypothetical protein